MVNWGPRWMFSCRSNRVIQWCEALFSSFALWAPLRGKFKVMTSSVVFQSFLENQCGLVSICQTVDFMFLFALQSQILYPYSFSGSFFIISQNVNVVNSFMRDSPSRSFGRPNAFSYRFTRMIPCCESLFSSSAVWASLQRKFQIMKAFRCMSSCCINFFSCPAGFAVSAGLLCLLGSLCRPR